MHFLSTRALRFFLLSCCLRFQLPNLFFFFSFLAIIYAFQKKTNDNSPTYFVFHQYTRFLTGTSLSYLYLIASDWAVLFVSHSIWLSCLICISQHLTSLSYLYLTASDWALICISQHLTELSHLYLTAFDWVVSFVSHSIWLPCPICISQHLTELSHLYLTASDWAVSFVSHSIWLSCLIHPKHC